MKPCRGNLGDSSPSRSILLPTIIPQASRRLGMISEAEFFESIPEGTVQARSDLLFESYLLRPSRFPKHEKHRTSRRLARTVTSVTWGRREKRAKVPGKPFITLFWGEGSRIDRAKYT